VPDAIFAHPRLAAVYDAFDGHRDDLDLYRGLAEERPGGHLVFETRRPGYRAWREWAADPGPVTLEVPGVGAVEQRRAVTRVDLPFVSFRYTYRFADGAVVTSDSTLRFRDREEVEASLAACGYRVLEVRDAPDRPGREFVFIAERLTASGRRSAVTDTDPQRGGDRRRPGSDSGIRWGGMRYG
jgi:hypothetical protein